jgi:putative sterol carrier protein
MSDNRLEKLTQRLRSAVEGSEALEGRLKYDLSPDGTIMIDGNRTPAQVSNEDGLADCTVEMDLETLERIVDGVTSPNSAFQQGLICMKGDMGIAMKTTAILMKVRA